MKIPFTKMSGAGNDFVVVDNRAGIIVDPQAFSVKVCERRFGIGADGVLLLESSGIAAFTMKYYNADGSNAGMCGNGGRCLAKFAYELGITSGEVFTFEGFGFIYTSRRHSANIYELSMKDPFGMVRNQTIPVNGQELTGNYLNTGTDHSVVFMDDNADLGSLAGLDVVGYGRPMRYHDVYKPAGANINFVERSGDNAITIRTYERGVEDETLACGTGSVASAVLSSLRYGMESPVEVRVKSGESLTVQFNRDDQAFRNVKLIGSALVTFTGFIERD